MHLPSELLERVVVIAGPTAVGKTGLALELAHRLNGEIVSMDSMQVYRGMDVGTAKPSLAERLSVPHHLIDVVDVAESFDASQFSELAVPAIQSILARGKVPLLCGGTGLYFKAVLEGLSAAPAPEPEFRAELEKKTLQELLALLEHYDPDALGLIDCRNPRRVRRALEITLVSGEKFSAQRQTAASPRSTRVGAFHWFGLARSPEDLRQRIDDRVDLMFREGLVEETATLLNSGLSDNRIAQQALGYRQVIDHLAGRATLPETIALVKSRTRKYAKRQMTWFRYQMRLQWLDCEPGASPEALLELVMNRTTTILDFKSGC